MSNDFDVLDEQNLLDNLGKIAYTLDKTYIEELSSDKYFCLPYEDIFHDDISYNANIRTCRVLRWVYNKNEKPGEALKNVLGTFSNGENSIALVIHRKPASVEIFFVVKNSILGGNEQIKNSGQLLRKSLIGNFQGSKISDIYTTKDTEEFFNFESFKSVSVLSNMPSKYSEDYITQGLDRIVESVVPENDEDSYSIVFLAESLSLANIRETLSGYEELATAIQPYLEYQYSRGKNETKTETESTSIAKNESISNSVFKTHSVSIGINHGAADTVSKTITKGISLFAKFLGANLSKSDSKSHTNSSGISAGYGYSWGKSKTITYGITNTEGMSSSISLGDTETSTYTYKSYLIKNIQEKLELIMGNINKSQSNGLWKYAAYVFAKDSATSKNIASLIKATTQGKESYISPAIVQEWSLKDSSEEHDNFKEIRKYVSHFIHPIFCSTSYELKDGQILRAENNMLVTASSLISTDELSQVMVIPKKSMPELPVTQGVEFGQEPHGIDKIKTDFSIGNAYHMYSENMNKKIFLSKQELKSHVFITGSTGSGKSNTVYQLLYELQKDNSTKFLVIEPAKGEYKNIFCTGDKPLAKLYGTNQEKTPLLRINPFSFYGDTHILEHLDRLVEIFNVCWPMYAAMPAVLKEAIEKSYEDVGWNLINNKNSYGINYFPTFSDVARNIKSIIDSSEYDSDNKGAYKGALLTRLKSLCNGINGLIFTENEISPEDLFENNNVVVDLSRVGSNETKSLIMGLLVLKLQEFRMSQAASGSIKANAELRHITVLEEAHNLLKKTSITQSSDSSNLVGKSVEMITNCIAEMRTYGEGFVIADQAPGLLDMAVIRNTNTKIIMRLPDQTDRELVGKSANLNEDQIVELARLDTGVAAIYQNRWIQPVLCKINKTKELKYEDIYKSKPDEYKFKGELSKENAIIITNLLLNNEKPSLILDDLKNMNISSYSKVIISDLYNGNIESPSFVLTGIVLAEIYEKATNELKKTMISSKDYSIWTNKVYKILDGEYKDYFNDQQTKNDVCQAIFTQVILNEMNKINILKDWSEGGYLR